MFSCNKCTVGADTPTQWVTLPSTRLHYSLQYSLPTMHCLAVASALENSYIQLGTSGFAISWTVSCAAIYRQSQFMYICVNIQAAYDMGTLRVVITRELVVLRLSGSFTIQLTSVRQHCHLHGHVSHEWREIHSLQCWRAKNYNLHNLSWDLAQGQGPSGNRTPTTDTILYTIVYIAV